MANGKDKYYFVVATAGQTADTLKAALDAARAGGYDQFYGMNNDFILLYGAPKGGS